MESRDEPGGPGGPQDGPGGPAPAGGSAAPDAPSAPAVAAPTVASPSASPAAAAAVPPGSKPRRKPRPHPYRHERSTPEEERLDATKVTLLWLGLATAIAVLGLVVSANVSYVVLHGERAPSAGVGYASFTACRQAGEDLMACAPEAWELWTQIPLFVGLALLAFAFAKRRWTHGYLIAGWLLFATYWALTARDLFIIENGDYVNMAFALVGVYFFTYLAYHQWLNGVRGVENDTVRFLNIGTFVAAGSYFIIDKIQPIRTWLILTVSDQTEWMLGLFGQGDAKGLQYLRDVGDPESPTNFRYPDWVGTVPEPEGFWGTVLHFNPVGQDPTVGSVSIILACTALQSIMLFVGLFMAVRASWRKRLVASVAVAVVVYVLNLLRNTGIIWFYGQGIMSFWVIHDAIGKGGSLLAMVAIAFGAFAWFPEFLRELIGVLDLPHRDGPLERTLRLGRRRPAAA